MEIDSRRPQLDELNTVGERLQINSDAKSENVQHLKDQLQGINNRWDAVVQRTRLKNKEVLQRNIVLVDLIYGQSFCLEIV